ncbi:AraC family transcriptional regulator [Rhodospirillum rubrum]|nr:AraC family transcriptional regulator [Rhodospirillum rubrum]MBK1678162.1 AraC family transcriptional regulator [Rhodospirillum rubrum]
MTDLLGKGRSSPTPPLRVETADWDKLLPSGGGWRETQIPLDEPGRMRFRIGWLGPSMTVTESQARLGREVTARIEQPGAVSTLCFGRAGSSVFGFGTDRPRHVVRAGDIWLFHGDDAVLTRQTPAQDQAVMVALKIPWARMAEVLEGSVRSGGGTRALRLDQEALSRFSLAPLLDNPLAGPLDRLMAESHALALLVRCLAPLAGGLADEPMDDSRPLARVLDRLMADLGNPPSLEDLARDAGMSHARLNRCFHRAYGKTVFAWLRDHRLERACRYLRQDGHSITEIAFLCGFSSSSHFASAFRQRFGCRPADYRLGKERA